MSTAIFLQPRKNKNKIEDIRLDKTAPQMAIVPDILRWLGMTKLPVIWFSTATLQPPHSSSSSLVAKGFIALLVLGTEAHRIIMFQQSI